MIDMVPDIGVNPDYGLTEEGEFRVKSDGLGDGYERRRPQGLNSHTRTWNLTWTGLDREQADILKSFFDSRLGVYAFLWYEPESGEAHKVIAPSPARRVFSTYNGYQIVVQLREDFNP